MWGVNVVKHAKGMTKTSVSEIGYLHQAQQQCSDQMLRNKHLQH